MIPEVPRVKQSVQRVVPKSGFLLLEVITAKLKRIHFFLNMHQMGNSEAGR